MDWTAEKKKIEDEFTKVKTQKEQADGVSKSCEVRMAQLQGKMETLNEMETREQEEKEAEKEKSVESKTEKK